MAGFPWSGSEELRPARAMGLFDAAAGRILLALLRSVARQDGAR
jgi:hypothetical protein